MKKQISTNDAKKALFLKQLNDMYQSSNSFQAFAMMETYKIDPETGSLTYRTFEDMERPKAENGEGEAGYQLGLKAGYTQLMRSINEPITSDWFIAIHDAMVKEITTSDLPDGIPTGFRDIRDGCEAISLVNGETFSHQGFLELNQKK